MAEQVRSSTRSGGALKETLAADSEDKKDSMTDDEMDRLAAKVAKNMAKNEEDSKDDSSEDKEEKLSANVALSVMLESHRGDGVADEKLRRDLSELRVQVLSGSDTPPAKLVATGKGLVKAHFEKVAEDGGDAGATLESVRPAGSPGGDFNVSKMLMGLFTDAKGGIESPDQLRGSPEAEMLKGIFSGDSERAKELTRKFSDIRTASKPGSSIIPIPLSALGIGQAQRLAQTYSGGGSNVDQYRSDDYRRDLLTMFHRPPGSLDKLGVMQITVSNDVNVPRVTAAQTASWVGENVDATDQSLTVDSTKSAAHRLAAKTDISWQLTAAADEIGITPLVIYELNRTMMQEREKAAFGKAATNRPTGLAGAVGVNDPGVGAAPTTLAHVKAFELALMVDNIPTDNLKWLLSVADANGLSSRLTFSASSALAAIPMFRSSMDVGPMGMSSGYDGFVVGRPACASNNVPADLGSSNNETMVVLGDWSNLLVIDYMMAFITVDDISQALAAQTRCTINSYHDVITRFPSAFAVDTHA